MLLPCCCDFKKSATHKREQEKTSDDKVLFFSFSEEYCRGILRAWKNGSYQYNGLCYKNDNQ